MTLFGQFVLSFARHGRMPALIALPHFRAGYRCPGWAGEGWEESNGGWCFGPGPGGSAQWAFTVLPESSAPVGADHPFELPGFLTWRLRRTLCCDTIVLPQWTMYIIPRSWVTWEEGALRLGPLLSGSQWSLRRG